MSYSCPGLPFTQANTSARTHVQASALLCWNEASPVPEQTLFLLEEVSHSYPSKPLSG